MTVPDPLQLYRTRACARQWRGFVQAMAEEFAAELAPAELSTLMARIGHRFAQRHSIGACATLDEVEAAANAVWTDAEWGQCHMAERADGVEILHAGAPLPVLLTGMDWSDGFLAGAYNGWFQQQGMLAGLGVRAQPADSPDLRRFLLARTA